ncbi:MAG: hypothetical protein ACRCSY_04030 [Cetobacterium sp.]
MEVLISILLQDFKVAMVLDVSFVIESVDKHPYLVIATTSDVVHATLSLFVSSKLEEGFRDEFKILKLVIGNITIFVPYSFSSIIRADAMPVKYEM